ncbi:protein snakeskin isoform X1 [Vespula maculifrons]|uniref:Protein snakeskin isoform X1 n=1 Tax=Vespula maculifrons TaxID=7453 RepID=A0ABD2AN14_VESMC
MSFYGKKESVISKMNDMMVGEVGVSTDNCCIGQGKESMVLRRNIINWQQSIALDYLVDYDEILVNTIKESSSPTVLVYINCLSPDAIAWIFDLP